MQKYQNFPILFSIALNVQHTDHQHKEKKCKLTLFWHYVIFCMKKSKSPNLTKLLYHKFKEFNMLCMKSIVFLLSSNEQLENKIKKIYKKQGHIKKKEAT